MMQRSTQACSRHMIAATRQAMMDDLHAMSLCGSWIVKSADGCSLGQIEVTIGIESTGGVASMDSAAHAIFSQRSDNSVIHYTLGLSMLSADICLQRVGGKGDETWTYTPSPGTASITWTCPGHPTTFLWERPGNAEEWDAYVNHVRMVWQAEIQLAKAMALCKRSEERARATATDS